MGKSLNVFLAELATDPDALERFLNAAEATMAAAGVEERDRELVRRGEAQDLLARLASDPSSPALSAQKSPYAECCEEGPELAAPSSKGSLVVVGSGIRSVGHLTVESIAQIKYAERVFYLVVEPVAEQVIRSLNPGGSESLADLYREGKVRSETYREMVERILASVRSGRRTCAVFYGHPGVFVYPAHAAIREARAEGFQAEMLAGVSAEDCLFADLGFDPATHGCQSYEATDFLINGREIDPSSHVILWQVGVLGDRTFSLTVRASSPLDLLIKRLSKTYPVDHEVCVYEASILPVCKAVLRWTQLAQLSGTQMSIISTLYIPPARPPRLDPELYFALSWPGLRK